MVEGDDKKKTRLNCIDRLLSQVPFIEIEHPAVELLKRLRHSEYSRRPVPRALFIPAKY